MSVSKKFWFASTGAMAVSVVLFGIGVLRNGTLDYWYLIYNLLLAIVPLLLSIWITHLLKKYSWKDGRLVVLTLMWLLILPNSFYIVTDFIHVADGGYRVDVVQDVVMLMQFSVLGLVAGFLSLDMLQRQWNIRLGEKKAMAISMGVLFLSSLAIYLGRELRWNSWDIVLHPLEVARDALFLWVDPHEFPGALWMIVSYFGMLSTLYLMWWYGRKIKI